MIVALCREVSKIWFSAASKLAASNVLSAALLIATVAVYASGVLSRSCTCSYNW